MTNEPGVISTSLIEFGQSGDYHTHSMTEVKEAAGFAPLETLPAEWYNNYIYKLDSHINRLQTVTRQMQVELSCVISSTSVEPSDTSLNQVNTAIQKKIADAAPGIATGSVAGVVTSSAALNAVSVDPATGVMTPNALCDWSGICTYSTVASWIGDWTNTATLADTISSLADTISSLCTCVQPLCDWDYDEMGTVKTYIDDNAFAPTSLSTVTTACCLRFTFADVTNTNTKPVYLDGLTLEYTAADNSLDRCVLLYAVADDSNKQLLSYCYRAASQLHTAVAGKWSADICPHVHRTQYSISPECLDPNTQAVYCMSCMNMNSINTYYYRCCHRPSDSRDSYVCYWQQMNTNGTLATTLNYGIEDTSEYWCKTYNTIYNFNNSTKVFNNADFSNALTMYGVNIRSYVCSSSDDASCGDCVLLTSGATAAVFGSNLAFCNYTNDFLASNSSWCNACLTLVGTCSKIGNECTADGTLCRSIVAVGNNNYATVYSTTAVNYSGSCYSTRPSALVLGDNNTAMIELSSENTTIPPYTAASMAVGSNANGYLRVKGTTVAACRASAFVGAIGNCVTANSYYACASKGEGRSLFVVGNGICAIQSTPHFGVFVFGSRALTVSCPSPINGAVGVMITSAPGYFDATFADLRCVLYGALGGDTKCSTRNITLHGSGQVGTSHTAIACILFTTSCAFAQTPANQTVNFALSDYANVVQLIGVVSYQLL